jgi:NADH-quinone oxidoreductase subunit C
MGLESITIQDKLTETFGESVFHFNQEKDIFSFEVTADIITAVVLFLKNDPSLQFHFLTDLCGVHYPENEIERQFTVVYHLHNWYENKRIKIKVFINGEKPQVKSLTTIFPSSNWMERETWDFYGIDFIGHPQLKRILNMEEMESHPMRKEFPMEDGGRTDKDDRFFGRTQANR